MGHFSAVVTPAAEAGLSGQIAVQVRAARQARGLSIRAAAAQLQCSPRFVLALEQGKPTARMDKVLQVLAGVGLQLSVHAGSANALAGATARTEARAAQGLREQKLAQAHARLATTLALGAIEPDAIERARAQVSKWSDQRICSQWYVDQWTGILAGSARDIALRLHTLKTSDAKALYQNTPFGFWVREHLGA